jgi:hypothetical protein
MAYAIRILALAALTLMFLSDGAALAQNRGQFCARWHNVCKKTCPAGVPKAACHATCEDRRERCLKTGCYFFNNPGPRCQGEQR